MKQPAFHDFVPYERPLEGAEKKLVNDMIAFMNRPGDIVEKVTAGLNFIGITAGGRMGLSSLLGAVPVKTELEVLDTLAGQSLARVAEYTGHLSPFLSALGFAAINAANTPDPDKVPPMDHPAEKLITRLGRGKTVGLVGEFPFVADIRQQVGTLHLFELRDVDGKVPRQDWERVLAGLDVLALTATTLLTRQMAWYLSHAAQARIIVIGPTTPAAPVLFDHGADFLCGSVVVEPETVTAGILEGLHFRELKQRGGIVFFQMEKSGI